MYRKTMQRVVLVCLLALGLSVAPTASGYAVLRRSDITPTRHWPSPKCNPAALRPLVLARRKPAGAEGW